MLPISDENGDTGIPPAVLVLILANLAVWVGLQGAGTEPAFSQSLCRFGFVPAEVLGGAGPIEACVVPRAQPALAAAVANFMHGGWLHLIGNMWFLFVFGRALESALGHARFLGLFVLSGAVAFAAHALVNLDATLPVVGASGAVSGVMGAYVVLFPHVRVRLLVFLGITITSFHVPALLMLGYWLLLQIAGAAQAQSADGAPVAFMAHIGGFACGLGLGAWARHTRPRWG